MLSGAQKQRIAIARAYLKSSPILLFDEISSALDPLTESYLQDSLSQIMQNRTTIVIAHRLATLHQMDPIIVMENGAIIEQGSRIELLNNPDSRFAKMCALQR